MRRPMPLWCLLVVITLQCWGTPPPFSRPNSYAAARERLAAAPPACRVVAERLVAVGGEELAERVGLAVALRAVDLAVECERLAAMPEVEMVEDLQGWLGPL